MKCRLTVSAGCMTRHFRSLLAHTTLGNKSQRILHTTHIPDTELLARKVHVLFAGRILCLTS